ncbi:MAG: HEAT repeat domain-containing protein [Bryobacteraceae bacterium]|nr:HEAT repeat domain-containing protein [Bryobacteraceae bacterium]
MSHASKSANPAPHGARSSARSTILLTALAVAFVAVPFLFWQGTWFGRPLKSEEIDRYLADDNHPRKIQHALSQIVTRISRGDPEAPRWYPRIVELARHPTTQIRVTAAWAMSQDGQSGAFHDVLRHLLRDPEVMVRRNAALSLIRFGDSAGREELLQMLAPYTVRAPVSGQASVQLVDGQEIGTGTLLARITASDGNVAEVRSPFAGNVNAIFARDGARVEEGAPLVAVEAGEDQVWEALRGLYLIGRPDDLPAIQRYEDAGDRIGKQAALTARSIRTRAEPTSTR